MKKILLFLITILGTLLVCSTDVHAQSYSFYEGEYIDGIYMVREKGSAHWYQKARFFRRVGDDKAAYCLEPFALFDENASYDISNTTNLSPEQIDRIKKIAYYGHDNNIVDHHGGVWYAVAQLLIWQTADPEGHYYFTDTLNGPETTRFQNFISQLNFFVNHHYELPSFANNEYVLNEGDTIRIKDTKGELHFFNFNSDIVKRIDSNTLEISAPKEGEYDITLTKGADATETYFFNSPNSQNLITTGSVDTVSTHIKVTVKKTKLKITKIDADTKSTTPSGEGILNGAEYDLLDENMNIVNHLTINENMEAEIENLKFGTYYLKETKAGTGYKLDEELHEISITKDTPIIEINLENSIIKKKIEILKKFGDNDKQSLESGVLFEIYNNKNEIIDTIITDKQGYASIELPYGNYTIRQKNSTKGYQKVEDFSVNITEKETDQLKFNLIDYVIKVPNTHSENSNPLIFLIKLIINLLYVKEKILL